MYLVRLWTVDPASGTYTIKQYFYEWSTSWIRTSDNMTHACTVRYVVSSAIVDVITLNQHYTYVDYL